MKHILAMDTSGPSLSVALMRENKLVFECTQQNGHTHSDSLMPLVDMALKIGGITVREVGCIAVVTGPGSFTGVRIGVTTAKSLAHAAGIPCMGINALEAIAAGAMAFPGLVCPMQDARAGQVYSAGYRQGVQVMPDAAVKLVDLLPNLEQEASVCFMGDGAVAHRQAIVEAMGERALFLPPDKMALHAGAVASLALQRPEKTMGWETLAPYYLRAPQAERERLAKEAAHG